MLTSDDIQALRKLSTDIKVLVDVEQARKVDQLESTRAFARDVCVTGCKKLFEIHSKI